MSLLPVPATSGTSTAARTAVHSSTFSSSVSVGASPVVPASDEPLAPVIDEPSSERDGAVEVERAVVVERRDHGREDPTEARGAISRSPRSLARSRAC